MQTWWTNFAIFQDPNGEDPNKVWPPITDVTQPQIFHINDQSHADLWPHQERCTYFAEANGGDWRSTCTAWSWINPY